MTLQPVQPAADHTISEYRRCPLACCGAAHTQRESDARARAEHEPEGVATPRCCDSHARARTHRAPGHSAGASLCAASAVSSAPATRARAHGTHSCCPTTSPSTHAATSPSAPLSGTHMPPVASTAVRQRCAGDAHTSAGTHAARWSASRNRANHASGNADGSEPLPRCRHGSATMQSADDAKRMRCISCTSASSDSPACASTARAWSRDGATTPQTRRATSDSTSDAACSLPATPAAGTRPAWPPSLSPTGLNDVRSASSDRSPAHAVACSRAVNARPRACRLAYRHKELCGAHGAASDRRRRDPPDRLRRRVGVEERHAVAVHERAERPRVGGTLAAAARTCTPAA
jgi:hypothetical protein